MEETDKILAQSNTIRKRYNGTAIFYDCMDRIVPDNLRKKAISQATGKVLEVGVGLVQILIGRLWIT